MAQAGYTPISLYYSTTVSAAPTAGNLASGELAINITDGKLFYKDNAGVVQVIGWKTVPVSGGGTGQTSLTANNVILGNGTSPVQFVAPGTAGNLLTSDGTTWTSSAAPATGVTSFSAGTTGFTPSTGTTGAVTLAGTLATTNGGTGLTTFTSGGAVYASSTSALTTGTLPVGSGGTGQTTYTDGQLLIGNTTGNTLTKSTLTAGTGISITNGSGSITIATSGGSSVNIGLTRAIAINCILP